uniref:Probable protein phosphatase 2C 51 n=1 Tax=Tanacetum cinerariifolium TaxID=118510 RepID=A0A6L2M5D7_TANCI|nr:probable protein phosphatase 2C 51 [Tanacetum cinerariifolium]
MNRVTDIPDSLLISFYISGLKLNLHNELLVSRPTTLGDAFSLARIIEDRWPLDVIQYTLLYLRSEDPNFKIQEKVVEYVRALNVAPLKVVFAGPVDEVRGKFAEFPEDKGCVEKVLSVTKLPEGGNTYSAYSPYHLEGKVIFKGVRNVTPWVADGERRKRAKCYVQGSERRKRKKVAVVDDVISKTEEVVTGPEKIDDFMGCLLLFNEASRYKFGCGSTTTIILIADSQILAANIRESKSFLCSETFQSPREAKATLLRLYIKRRRDRASARIKDYRNFNVPVSDGLPHFSAKELTMDHQPDRVGERSRVESYGGQVSERGGVSRVNGRLDVSRAIGDFLFKR